MLLIAPAEDVECHFRASHLSRKGKLHRHGTLENRKWLGDGEPMQRHVNGNPAAYVPLPEEVAKAQRELVE